VSILVTGFEPWGRLRRNPSGELALALGGHVLPVDFRRAERRLLSLVRRLRPEAILMLGLAQRRSRIELEAVALNVDHSEEGGRRAWRRPIGKGPLALPARLPLERLYRRLRAARIPVAISHHAGTFVCNHVFYAALAATHVPCGFVHVPPTGRLSFATQLRAARLILEELGQEGVQAVPSRIASSWP
jgi:pyroglutamyl-peptidase